MLSVIIRVDLHCLEQRLALAEIIIRATRYGLHLLDQNGQLLRNEVCEGSASQRRIECVLANLAKQLGLCLEQGGEAVGRDFAGVLHEADDVVGFYLRRSAIGRRPTYPHWVRPDEW